MPTTKEKLEIHNAFDLWHMDGRRIKAKTTIVK